MVNSYQYRPGFRAVGAQQGFWLSLSEEDFASELRTAGWSDKAIGQELETLRAYKAQFRLDRPVVRTLDEIVEQIPEEGRESSRMGALALIKRRQRTERPRNELDDEE